MMKGGMALWMATLIGWNVAAAAELGEPPAAPAPAAAETRVPPPAPVATPPPRPVERAAPPAKPVERVVPAKPVEPPRPAPATPAPRPVETPAPGATPSASPDSTTTTAAAGLACWLTGFAMLVLGFAAGFVARHLVSRRQLGGMTVRIGTWRGIP